MSDGTARNVRVIAAAALIVAFVCGALVGALALRTWSAPRTGAQGQEHGARGHHEEGSEG